MTDDDLPLLDLDEVPDDAHILQAGEVIGADGVVGRVDPEDVTPTPLYLDQ